MSDFILSVEGVTDTKAFIRELILFYAPHNVNLTLFGSLPDDLNEKLKHI